MSVMLRVMIKCSLLQGFFEGAMSNKTTAAASAALAAVPIGDDVEAEGWDTDPEVGEDGEGEEGAGEGGEGGKFLTYCNLSL